jgi:hypothetical protein
MTLQEIYEVVHSAFYRVVRDIQPVPIEYFFNLKIEETWPPGGSPSGWPDFWWESVAVEIQNAVMARREYILDFNAKWLKDNKTKTWNELVDYISRKLVPLF